MLDGNECRDRIEGCRGAGSPEHIKHCLEKMSISQLMGVILSHCGDNFSQFRSCMCYHYAREIGRRAGMRD